MHFYFFFVAIATISHIMLFAEVECSRNHHISAPKDGDAHYTHDKSVMVACGHEGLVDICTPVLQDGDDIFGGHAGCGRGGGRFRGAPLSSGTKRNSPDSSECMRSV